MDYFVDKNSVVRSIWGKSDTILFIFAGASAEFALNKAVDWLYFTGRLPADPLGRLFSTVAYAREIVFSSTAEAHKSIEKINAIHTGLEKARGYVIPDWAYRDVLFMLIHYSIAAFELLERKLTLPEKEEVFDVFYRVGQQMRLKDLPTNYEDWCSMRQAHMENNLQKSHYTIDLFKQYKKHLGIIRYTLLIEGQKLVVPLQIKKLMGFNNTSLLQPIVVLYKVFRKLNMDWLLKAAILPPAYKAQIKALDHMPY